MVIIFNFIILSSFINQKPKSVNQNVVNNINQDLNLRSSGLESYELEWLDNRTFDLPVTEWYNQSEGDISDVNASLSNGYGNLELLGDMGTFSSSTYESYPNETGTWMAFNNSHSYPIKDPGDRDLQSYGIDQNGWWCSHEWDQNSGLAVDQNPSINWKKNYTINVDLADFKITTASIDAIINGTVKAITYGAGGVECPGDDIPQEYAVYDFARFYIQIANIEGTHKFELAYNKTRTLGDDDNADVFDLDYMNNVHLTTYGENILIAYLTAIFENTAYDMFTIILGIDIYCEDNVQVDNDKFNELRFNNFSLNFTYVKKMDRYAAISWDQDGNRVPPGANVQVDYATLEFGVKINKKFTADSPNSEVRALINGNKFVETIKLDKLNVTADNITLDVTPLIQKGINITTSIQVMLLDNFVLNESIIISIDNISLMIKYSIVSGLTLTDYVLKLNDINKTLSKLIEIEWGEIVNITVMYREDITKNFVDNATVQISGAIPTANLTENLSLEHYNFTMDTSTLSIGENLFTIFASKIGFVDQEFIVNIKVLKRSIDMNIFLNGVNKTSEKSIFLKAGDPLNITLTLKDSITNNFVDNADVKIYNGEYWNKTLNETISLQHYNTSVNTTKELTPGITFLTLLISKANYNPIGDSITISISVRASNYSLELDGEDKTSYPTIAKNINKTIDIRFYYRDDLDKTHIGGANVTLTIVSVEYDLEENETGGYYNISINTLDLNQGINFATVFAQHPQYTPQALLITIDIIQKETEFKLFINGTEKTGDPYYTVIVGDYLNITITYLDNETKAHIINASVQLFGGGIDGNFTQYEALKQFVMIIDSRNLSTVINFLSIYAIKTNFEAQSIAVRVDVIDKASEAQLFLDTINKTTERYIELLWNEILNITITYVDNDTNHIGDANVSISGSGISKDFAKGSSQYELYLNTTELGVGIHFLVILATKANYETQTISIQIDITRRVAIIDKVFINQIEQKVYGTLWDETINFTIIYLDNATNTTIFGASLQLKEGGTLIGNFIYDSVHDQFNFSINSASLEIGLHYITISAVLENYTSVSEVLTININQRDTGFELWLNNTITSSIAIDWNEILDITVVYNDTATGNPIDSALIQLKDGATLIGTFAQNAGQYDLSINTTVLGVGAVYLTVTAEKGNYSSFTQFIFITINNRQTTLDIFLNGVNITLDKFAEVPLGRELKISLIYQDARTNATIIGATIDLKLKSLTLGSFVYNLINETYNITANTGANFEIGLNILTIEAQLQNYTLENPTLRITINRIDVDITPEDGISLIKAEPGDDILIRVELVNNDFGGRLKGATVTFTSNIPIEQYQEGTLEEVSPGVYEILLENVNVPPGTYILTISVAGGGTFDNYDIERIDITIDIKAPESILFQILTLIAVCAVIAIGAYAIYYQRVGKYPVPVRKVRKTKKMFKKKKFRDLGIADRKDLIKDLYEEEFQECSKTLRPKAKKSLITAIPIIKDKLAAKKKPKEQISKKPIPKKEPEKPAPKKEPEKPSST